MRIILVQNEAMQLGVSLILLELMHHYLIINDWFRWILSLSFVSSFVTFLPFI